MSRLSNYVTDWQRLLANVSMLTRVWLYHWYQCHYHYTNVHSLVVPLVSMPVPLPPVSDGSRGLAAYQQASQLYDQPAVPPPWCHPYQ